MDKRRKRKPIRPAEIVGPIITTRLPKWGATKQAADAFAEIRALKNRIAELETTRSVASAVASEDTSWHPTGTEIEALGKVLAVPITTAHGLGLASEFVALAALYMRLHKWNRERIASTVNGIRRAGGVKGTTWGIP